ncbi:MAG: urea carboxylase-associated family protein [Paracoccaceae bacterium]|uniref:urea carboxylase-associated family protein n=1 Tax=Parasphingorhabdus sp. TaxID=2709688 RepID=UPI00327AF720
MDPAIYDPSVPDGLGDHDTQDLISKTGDPELGRRYLIPARQGCAVRIKAGQILTLYNPKGNQVCDFFALIDGSESEFLSMEHCRTALGRIYVRECDVLVTNRRRPLVEFVEDSSPGVHDILIACCDHHRYQQLGAQGYHDNCADNFRRSLLAIGIKAKHVPSPFNVWMNIPVSLEGDYSWEAPVSKPGDFIRLRALEDAIFVMSACPQDMTPVNGIGVEPAELEFEINLEGTD